MELQRIIRTSIGKGAWATYAFRGFKLEVYVRHNVPCQKYWGPISVSCYKNMNDGSADGKESWTFDSYSGFRQLRALLCSEEAFNIALDGEVKKLRILKD
jgi:hypothetical protein